VLHRAEDPPPLSALPAGESLSGQVLAPAAT